MAGLEATGHVGVGKGRPQPSGAEGGNCRCAPVYPPLAAVLREEAAGHVSGEGRARGGGHVSGEGRTKAKVLRSKLSVPQRGTQLGVPPTTQLFYSEEVGRTRAW